MAGFILSRILTAIPVIFLMTIAVFVVMNILPGDPTERIGGDAGVSEESSQRLRDQLGLDDPLPIRYVNWMTDMLQGDFGTSIPQRTPVRDMILDTLPVTLELAFFAVLIMLSIGIPLGVLAAYFKGSIIDTVASGIGAVGISIPGFWLGILLIYLFSIELQWLPSTGFVSVTDDPVDGIKHMILPALALAAPGIAITTRQTRSSLLDVLSEDYVRTALAKGLLNRTVVTRHAMRNAIIPVTTVVGLQIAFLLGGSVVIETVFAIPGIGRLITDAVFYRDFPVVQSVAVVIVVLVMVLNIIVDLFYSILDPRIRLSQ